MNSFSKLKDLNIKVSKNESKRLRNEYKGNIFSIRYKVTDHVAKRFYERHLNNTNYNINTVREYIEKLVFDKGIEGYSKNESIYIAIPNYGLFIAKGIVLVTFIGVDNLSRKNQDLYVKLLNKGRIK